MLPSRHILNRPFIMAILAHTTPSDQYVNLTDIAYESRGEVDGLAID
jgi:hypothetical protein